MTTHELAKALLALPDKEFFVFHPNVGLTPGDAQVKYMHLQQQFNTYLFPWEESHPRWPVGIVNDAVIIEFMT